jgi:hypothetical protein
VTSLNQVRSGTIDDDLTRAFWPRNDVGFEAGSIGHGGDEYFFTVPQIDGAHEVGRDRDAAFVVNVGIGDSCAMDLGFELDSKHGNSMCPSLPQGQDGNGESDQPGVRRPNLRSNSPAVI